MHKINEDTRKSFLKYKKKKDYFLVTTALIPTTASYPDRISGFSDRKVITSIQEYLHDSVMAVDVVQDEKENTYRAKHIIRHPAVETMKEFEDLFQQQVSEVKLSISNVEDIFIGQTLDDGTKIKSDGTITFEEPKDYVEAEKYADIVLRYLEFMSGKTLNIDEILFKTVHQKEMHKLFPKRLLNKFSVPSRESIQKMFCPIDGQKKNKARVEVILKVWIWFFSEMKNSSFFEAMADVMKPYDYASKNIIVTRRVDFLASMVKVVYKKKIPVKIYTSKLLEMMLEMPTNKTTKTYKREKGIIKRCKNLRNLIIHHIQEEHSNTNVSSEDYEIFETFFYESFAHLMIEYVREIKKDEKIVNS